MKIIIIAAIIVGIIGVCGYLYMRHFTRNTPSIVGNEYDRKMQQQLEQAQVQQQQMHEESSMSEVSEKK
jgi:Flp pilus assembly protein CpaB